MVPVPTTWTTFFLDMDPPGRCVMGRPPGTILDFPRWPLAAPEQMDTGIP
jgi:hypothetical protein